MDFLWFSTVSLCVVLFDCVSVGEPVMLGWCGNVEVVADEGARVAVLCCVSILNINFIENNKDRYCHDGNNIMLLHMALANCHFHWLNYRKCSWFLDYWKCHRSLFLHSDPWFLPLKLQDYLQWFNSSSKIQKEFQNTSYFLKSQNVGNQTILKRRAANILETDLINSWKSGI